jgi:hypothetical protein
MNWFAKEALFGTLTGNPITAHFTNGTTADYTTAIWNLLVTDPDVEFITDGETGEILYAR